MFNIQVKPDITCVLGLVILPKQFSYQLNGTILDQDKQHNNDDGYSKGVAIYINAIHQKTRQFLCQHCMAMGNGY